MLYNGSMKLKKTHSLQERCTKRLLEIPRGKITTYKELARSVGSTSARAVGTAIAKNEWLIDVPCHRVIRSDHSIGQYAMGSDKKIALLRSEGIPIKNGKIQQIDKYLHLF